jgi:hypothetical protein
MPHPLLCSLAAYGISSAWESVAHQSILHAHARHNQVWRRYGVLGLLLRRARFNHLIHHASTQSPTWTEERISKTTLLSSGIIKQLRETNFGKTINPTPDALLLFSGVPLLLIIPLFLIVAPESVWVGVMIGLIPFAMTRYVHPHLHRSAAAIPEATRHSFAAQPAASALQSLRHYHGQHHEQPWTNFNLTPGFDLCFQLRSRLKAGNKPGRGERQLV